jgi:hypothetical protein
MTILFLEMVPGTNPNAIVRVPALPGRLKVAQHEVLGRAKERRVPQGRLNLQFVR